MQKKRRYKFIYSDSTKMVSHKHGTEQLIDGFVVFKEFVSRGGFGTHFGLHYNDLLIESCSQIQGFQIKQGYRKLQSD